MPGQEDSLFSLELVVEKVYIPHIPCHFPAVAFRLLDFPTIIISHVEDDLAKTIKGKISRDPYYEIPAQFSELKDKHGNFMINKGKSCLFKITVDSLKLHLANTPLYVMLIDTFPEVPKLLGNSTVPLNFIMDEICVDIAKMGTIVPSVHGDKGLFKLYSLMGKEIGYFVLGFRLLCLGPSLIPHLPEGALLRRSAKSTRKEDVVAQQIVHVQEVDDGESDAEVAVLKDTREMGSMTDVEKHDMIIQTLQMDDKAVHVAVSAPEDKTIVTTATQTVKHKRTVRKVNPKVHEKCEDEDFIINNFVCPPPLFYNCKTQPPLKIKQMVYYETCTDDDLSVDNLESTSEDGDFKTKPSKVNSVKEEVLHDGTTKNDVETKYEYDRPVKSIAKAFEDKRNSCLGVASGQDALFPILTALLNELSCIQNPQLLQNVSRNVQQLKIQQKSNVQDINRKVSEERSKPFVQDRKAHDKENVPVAGYPKPTKESSVSSPGKKKVRQCAQPHELVSKNKGWLRKVPEYHSPKKTQLIYRLTNTQRLRLAKTNPQWLEAVEKEEAEAKKRQQAASQKNTESDDLDVTNFSDTLTEVRRLAEKEYQKKGDETMDSLLDVSTLRSGKNQRRVHHKHRSQSSKGKSPSRPLRGQTPSPKHKQPKIIQVKSALSDDFDDYDNQGILSPELNNRPLDNDTSLRSDLPSSQKSIEVRLPSAQGYDKEDSDNTMDEEDEVSSDEISHGRGRNFLGFGKNNITSPGVINGKPNASLMQSIDYDQPLESTRLSKHFDGNARSRTLESTEDFDTHQFHSTEEPELLGLVSGEDHHSDVNDSARQGKLQVSASVASSVKFPVLNPTASEQSPIPATRRSTVRLETGLSGSLSGTPGSISTGSSKRPTPQPRKPTVGKLESVHTESVSSYLPSDPENMVTSLNSDANYSDDFHSLRGQDSLTDISSPDLSVQRFIPDSKLAYTIN
ncbi:microtubule-associated protein 10-like [Gigantopelta aegis]|uniref:microtubule-associated protein 10-like n=1 Tax=Gigantopelta aegis TaxID=1735272 RepID=UPI001B888B94|nr:microtubule-associated protein 10-like [Gigantopelta aegis]